MERIRCYSELVLLPTFEERFRYLQLGGIVGQETFGFDRHMNQFFYRSPEWRQVRDVVIARDAGCDLGIAGREIFGRVLIHHMNPIRPEDIRERNDILLNPEYLITTVHETHQAVHYGDESLLIMVPIERVRNDTCPWKT
ncbi:hypothetical protein D1159_05760 [Pseudoflavonifractor sp. 524-17]|nr:hypothetical protein [Pseudoflavonifractor sp. 524-17]NCE64104.1 hypothetical protein [Pseudoflavonifractor sp. 524-17]